MNENTEENKYKECYIAYIDILGFKNIIKEDQMCCDELLKVLTTPKNKTLKNIYAFENNTESLISPVQYHIMSDSLVYYIDVSEKNAFLSIVVNCSNIIRQMAFLSNPIFVRGAITKGKIYYNKDIIFGPGLIRAYELEENIAIFPRIIIDGLLDEEITDSQHLFTSNKLYDLFFNKGIYIDEDDIKSIKASFELFESNERQIDSYYNIIKENFNRAVNDSIRNKYLYLMKYYKIK